MFLALHDQPSEVDPWRYFLAEKLGKLPHELDAIPHTDWMALKAYYSVKSVIENKQKVG